MQTLSPFWCEAAVLLRKVKGRNNTSTQLSLLLCCRDLNEMKSLQPRSGPVRFYFPCSAIIRSTCPTRQPHAKHQRVNVERLLVCSSSLSGLKYQVQLLHDQVLNVSGIMETCGSDEQHLSTSTLSDFGSAGVVCRFGCLTPPSSSSEGKLGGFSQMWVQRSASDTSVIHSEQAVCWFRWTLLITTEWALL